MSVDYIGFELARLEHEHRMEEIRELDIGAWVDDLTTDP